MFQQYVDSTRLPFTSLAFLIPMLVIYETGAIFLRPAGSWASGVVLVPPLVAWQILPKDPTAERAWAQQRIR